MTSPTSDGDNRQQARGPSARTVRLLRVIPQGFLLVAFAVLAVIGLATGSWFGWVFLALAALHGTATVVRWRRLSRSIDGS